MPFLLVAGLAFLPESSEVHGTLHAALHFPHDDHEPLPAPLLPQVEPILVDADENPMVDHLGRLQDANPLADGKVHLQGAEVRQDAE